MGTTETQTTQNLKDAFAGESQANRKYLAFAKKAQEEGFPQIAKLFRAAAEAETIHAHAHLRVLGGVKGTADNLKAAIEGEGFEFEKMYPQFVQQAQAEGQKDAVRSFSLAMAVEKIHHGLYTGALTTFQSGKACRPSRSGSARCAGTRLPGRPRTHARSAAPRRRSSLRFGRGRQEASGKRQEARGRQASSRVASCRCESYR